VTDCCQHSFPDSYPAPLDHIGDCRNCGISYQAAKAQQLAASSPGRAADQERPETPGGDNTALVARILVWVESDVVTARNEFGDGYREAQRDIRDLIIGRPATTARQEGAQP